MRVSLKQLGYQPLLCAVLMVFSPGQTANCATTDKAVVTIDSFQFKPQKTTVKKGGSVTFKNNDAAPHTVSPASGAKFVGTGRLLKDETKVVQFNEVGSNDYFCDFHPSMKGTVVVVEK